MLVDVFIGSVVVIVFGFDDVVIDFEVMFNCLDMLVVFGVVRDLVVVGLGKLIIFDVIFVEGVFLCLILIGFKFIDEIVIVCFYFVGCVVCGVRNGLLLEWM